MDGARMLIKLEIEKEQLKSRGRKLQNTSEVVFFFKEKCNKFHVSYAHVKAHVNNFFHEVKERHVDQSWEFGCGTIKGSCGMQ